MPAHCEHCHDGYGGTVYPYYGVGPHVCGWRLGKPVVGHSEGIPASEWPENFQPDPEHGDQDDGKPPLGVWTHCMHCGAGKEPTPQAPLSAGLSHGADHGEH